MTPQKFWMVWVHDTPTTKKRHTTLDSAVQEAERVARQPANIGKPVYVLEPTVYCHVDLVPVVWQNI